MVKLQKNHQSYIEIKRWWKGEGLSVGRGRGLESLGGKLETGVGGGGAPLMGQGRRGTVKPKVMRALRLRWFRPHLGKSDVGCKLGRGLRIFGSTANTWG